MAKPRVAVIVGSNRRDSINRKLAHALARLVGDRVDAYFPVSYTHLARWSLS